VKRPAPWQARRIATAKALRALPKCEWCGIKRGMGFSREGSWLCVKCAADAQRAQREKREQT
jgi:hypothetical protein